MREDEMQDHQDERTEEFRTWLDHSKVEEVKSRLSDYGQAASERALRELDAGREKMSHAMEASAERLRARAEDEHGITRVGAKTAAFGIDNSGRFLHDHSVSDLSVLGGLIRAHPYIAVFLALLCGYSLGRLFSSSSGATEH